MDKTAKLVIECGTEKEVEDITEVLANEGLMYDEDFTTLYGAQWKMVGVQLMQNHVRAVTAIAHLLKDEN